MGYKTYHPPCSGHECIKDFHKNFHHQEPEFQFPKPTFKPIIKTLHDLTSTISNVLTYKPPKDTIGSNVHNATYEVMQITTQTPSPTPILDSNFHNHVINPTTEIVTQAVEANATASPMIYYTSTAHPSMEMITQSFGDKITLPSIINTNLSSNFNETIEGSSKGIINGAFEGVINPTEMVNLTQNSLPSLNSSDIGTMMNNTIDQAFNSNVNIMENNETPAMELINSTGMPLDQSLNATHIGSSIPTTIADAVEATTAYVKNTIITTLKQDEDPTFHNQKEPVSDHSHKGIYAMLFIMLAILILIVVLLVVVYVRYRKRTQNNCGSYNFDQKAQKPISKDEDSDASLKIHTTNLHQQLEGRC